MLGLLVEVPEPLPIDRDPRAYPPLVLNSFVRVAILGRTLRNAVALPRRSVRDGSVVWVMAEDDRLEIRPVEIAYRGRDDFILRSGVAAGERIVVSDLTAPVAGMALRAVEN
jgi:multidrug efflux pump subunit AcrA (membrane-fusion protein)